MRLHPKVIPVISREAIQLLMQDGDIEVEPMRIADAEMDLLAIMREYLTNEERVDQATREELERRRADVGKFDQVKHEMADLRGFKMGEEGIDYVVDQLVEFLLLSRNVEEVFSADDVLRKKILAVVKKHLATEPEPSGGSGGPPQGSPTGHPGPTGAPAEVCAPRPRSPDPVDADDGLDVE